MIWVAYHHDFSEFAIFDTELLCLRYAVEHSMEVGEFEIGRGIREQVQEQWTARNPTPRPLTQPRYLGRPDA